MTAIALKMLPFNIGFVNKMLIMEIVFEQDLDAWRITTA